MSKLNLTENVYSQAHKKQQTNLKQQQTGLTHVTRYVKKKKKIKIEEITENLLSVIQFY